MEKSFIIVFVFICLSACGVAVQNAPIDVSETSTIRPTRPSVLSSPTTFITPAPEATKTIIAPTPTPETTTYYDSELKIQISYPKNWVEKSKGVFVGQGGYVIIKKLGNYSSADLVNVAIDFANTNYSKYRPSVHCIGFGNGCAISMRGPNLSGNEVEKIISVIPYYQGTNFAKYFSIETTRDYYMLIDESIIRDSAHSESTPSAEYTGLPKPIKMSFEEGISIQEILLSEFDVNDEEYSHAYSTGTGSNCGITNIQPNPDLSVSSSNNDRITAHNHYEIIYEYASWVFNEPNPWSFCTWGEHWMMETHDVVIIDGEVLNHKLGYEEIFGWHLLSGKQTFFVMQNRKYQISFDGKLLPIKYDEINHYRYYGGYNPRTNGTKTWFDARRDGTWFRVIISED